MTLEQMTRTEEMPALPLEWAEQLALSESRWGQHAAGVPSERFRRRRVSTVWWWIGVAALVGTLLGLVLPQPGPDRGGGPGGVDVVPVTTPPAPTTGQASRPTRQERRATVPTSAKVAPDRYRTDTVTRPTRIRQMTASTSEASREIQTVTVTSSPAPTPRSPTMPPTSTSTTSTEPEGQ